jgi:hypothetical protein
MTGCGECFTLGALIGASVVCALVVIGYAVLQMNKPRLPVPPPVEDSE